MYVDNTLKQALLRDSFIKKELKKIRTEGVDVDQVYIEEIIKRSFKGCLILDIGTGTAHIPIEIVKNARNVNIIAIDVSSASIRIAKRNASKFKNIHFLRADGYNLPFKDSSFDEIIVRLAPHSLREVYRTLKKGGWYIHRACGEYNCWKEAHEIFGKRALPYARASWWRSSFTRLERYSSIGFKEVFEISFLVRKYYTFNQMVKEMQFNPIIENFDLKKDMEKLRELEKRYKTDFGIRITADPLILFAKK